MPTHCAKPSVYVKATRPGGGGDLPKFGGCHFDYIGVHLGVALTLGNYKIATANTDKLTWQERCWDLTSVLGANWRRASPHALVHYGMLLLR